MTETMRIPRVWGATADEVRAGYPCDDLLSNPRESWFRAVTVRAERATVFRWLCQLKVAPYSYDLLDNLGRRSPRLLTPGAEDLAVGQQVMTIFELVAFEPDQHLTLLMRNAHGRRLFGDFAVTYTVTDIAPRGTRLLAKLMIGDRDGILGRSRRHLLAWGDLFMMRRQLNTLRELAERQQNH
ncbi:hypothetical protein [Actinopolymorpha alba]|uniref:hypothetical protein n=1 Tax=Actinopolymorpha alba TaxID=533267 RepID=UPI000369DE5E|nr:hypothetical protein [Actinopolymorpha alba]